MNHTVSVQMYLYKKEWTKVKIDSCVTIHFFLWMTRLYDNFLQGSRIQRSGYPDQDGDVRVEDPHGQSPDHPLRGDGSQHHPDPGTDMPPLQNYSKKTLFD